MNILDRYIGRLFLLNFIILFVVTVGLVVLADLLIFNLDEFMQAAQAAEGGWWSRTTYTLWLIADFWGPMVFLLYGYLVGLVPIGAAGFTFWTLIRNRELLAMLAGGLSMYRIAMPVLVLGFAANMLMLANQELVLPRLAPKLARSQADLKRGGARPIELRFVPDADGSLYSAAAFDPQTGTIDELTILRRQPLPAGGFGPAIERITASAARWDPQARGWRLTDGLAVRIEPGAPAADGRLADRRPIGFVRSDLDPLTLRLSEQSRYAQLLGLDQLSELMARPTVIDKAMIRRTMHSRFSMVVLNMLILAMTLPQFLLRVPAALLAPAVRASVLGVGAWAGGFIMLQIPPQTLTPAAVAWLPVALYLPVAYYLMDSVET